MTLDDQQRQWISKIKSVMDSLREAFTDPKILRSRAVVLSTVLLGYELRDEEWFDAMELAQFIEGFVKQVREQVNKRALTMIGSFGTCSIFKST